MKRIILTFLAVITCVSFSYAAKERVSILFIHYSVGTQITQGYCWNPIYRRNITETLDTMTIVVANDTADIVFRSYRMNNEGAGNPLSDTLPGTVDNGCAFDRFNNFEYDFYGANYNRMRIWNSDNGFSGDAFAGIINQFFNVPGKEDSVFWKIFKTHNVPSSFPDSVTEVDGYDLVIIKNPFACWAQMTQAQADSIRVLYQILRDSIVAHPEINVALAFGTPLVIGPEQADSSMGKITYELATWFASDSFFTHTNTGKYKNIWKWDSYRILCEMSSDSANRYCLKREYSVAPDAGDSHLSNAGATRAQESMTDFIREAVTDILIQRAGNPDQPPVLDPIPDTSITEGKTLALRIYAYDPNGTVPSLSAVNIPYNAIFTDSGNGAAAFVFKPNYIQAGGYDMTFIASDGVLADSQIVSITVLDATDVGRVDIDKKIQDFRLGNATIEEVTELIRQYNENNK